MTEDVRLNQIEDWLTTVLPEIFREQAWGEVPAGSLTAASSDASFRRYFRWAGEGRSLIVMDAPPPQEDCRPFVQVAALLAAAGVHVPRILAQDLERGFLLLSDLGTLTYLEVINAANADDYFQAAIDALLAYHWPGNVRELERIMERAVALAGSDRIEVDDLPPALLGGYEDIILPSLRRRDTMREWGSRYARLVLERCENNKRRACRELGISYHTLRAYLRSRPRSRSPGGEG